MQFSQLYQDELTRELGTADRTQRFTDVRRKAAINAGQLEFLDRTECFTRDTTIALVDGTAEYDLEAAIADFLRISKAGVSIAIVDANNNTRYIEGDALVVTTRAKLNQEQPGWRAVGKSTPAFVYEKRDGGAIKIGLTPAPSIAVGETWTLLIPYVALMPDMVADGDVPFTVAANAIASLAPYHRGLAHFGAYDLEKLRKDVNAQQKQFALFEQYVDRFNSSMALKGGTRVRFVRDYRREARYGMGRLSRLSRRVYP